MTSPARELRDAIAGIFQQVRQVPNAPYEPERFLAFLTAPPAAGKRVADTFVGRRRFVRFMNAVQRELAICFTQEEWERGFGLDEVAALAAAKRAKPDQGLRLAKKRLEEALRRRTGEPVKFSILMLPILVGAIVADSWLFKGTLLLLWVAAVAAVTALSVAEVRYSRELMSRIEELRGSPET